MKREELIRSVEYWLTKFQIKLFNKVNDYIKKNNLNRDKFAKQLGVSKGYVSQILNGNADHRMSKFIELSLAIGLVPTISFESIDDFIQRDLQSDRSALLMDIKKSKQIVRDAGYLLSEKPVNEYIYHDTPSEDWSNIDTTSDNNFFSMAS
ncbi:MAG: helix-turn-helix transcriptional regulator [Bacteroidales bacterium]|nr:helix-turn-helix transcriptional regulator [Bacteroidales bacterium]